MCIDEEKKIDMATVSVKLDDTEKIQMQIEWGVAMMNPALWSTSAPSMCNPTQGRFDEIGRLHQGEGPRTVHVRGPAVALKLLERGACRISDSDRPCTPYQMPAKVPSSQSKMVWCARYIAPKWQCSPAPSASVSFTSCLGEFSAA